MYESRSSGATPAVGCLVLVLLMAAVIICVIAAIMAPPTRTVHFSQPSPSVGIGTALHTP